MKLQAISPDRISALPEPIIHRILSLLPTKSVKLATSLSKTWYDFCSSFPYLDFDDYFFESMFPDDTSEYTLDDDEFDPNLKPHREKYLNYFGETLRRFHERNPRILIRRIRIPIILINSSFVSRLGDCIRLALEHGVEKIDLRTRGYCFNLPGEVFAPNSIRVLKLAGCSLLKSFRHGDISVSSSKLRKLDIEEVHIDELALTSLISIFPLMEKLAIEDAMGLTNLRIARLYRLKSLVVSNVISDKIMMVEVDAPILHCLKILNNTSSGRPPIKIGILDCPRLSKLTLSGVEVENFQLEGILSRLPFLGSLKLTNLLLLTKFKISNDSLSKLSVIRCTHLVDLEIDAPRLLSFAFDAYSVPLMATSSSINNWILNFPRLAKLTMSDVGVENFQLEGILSRLPFLCSLKLNNLILLTKFKISNDSLYKLAIISCEHLVELEIDAPKLLSFEFQSNSIPHMAPMHTIMGQSCITLDIGWEPSLYDNFVVKLRNFLSLLNRVNYLCMNLKDFAMISVDELVQPVINTEELKIVVENTPRSLQEIFNGLLLSYHPRTLTMELQLVKTDDVMTFLQAIMAGNDCGTPYLEEVMIVDDDDNVTRLPMDGTVPSITLESEFWGVIKFALKW